MARDFAEGFLSGLYNSGLGNPEVQERRKQSALQEAYYNQQMQMQAAEQGLMPDTNQVHPKTSGVLDFIRGALFGDRPNLNTAFVPDPNARRVWVGNKGEVSDNPISGGIQLNPKESRELLTNIAKQPDLVVVSKDAVGNVTNVTNLGKGKRSAGIAGPSATGKGVKPGSSVEATLNLYETAREGLLTALNKTVRGPLVGLSPSLTANQQNADQAIAAMAPVLKQLFRVAGEGVFTDRDQQLLLDMIPTRKTEDVATQIQNIDNIVKAKLGLGGTSIQSFNSIEEAEAANLPPGTEITIGGRRAVIE